MSPCVTRGQRGHNGLMAGAQRDCPAPRKRPSCPPDPLAGIDARGPTPGAPTPSRRGRRSGDGVEGAAAAGPVVVEDGGLNEETQGAPAPSRITHHRSRKSPAGARTG